MFSPKSKRGLPVSAAIVAAFSVFALSGAFGQDQDSDVIVLEELEVGATTGSRLFLADFEGGLPTNLYTAADIAATPAMTISNYLRFIPTTYGVGNRDESFVNGGDGRATIQLRGLPTLLLVNGRRVTSGDLNVVPLLAVDHIDILKDGNGAVYGADAVGGVVNIITKKRFEGFTADAFYQNTTSGDIGRHRLEAIWGDYSDKGSTLIGVSYFKQNSLFGTERDHITNSNNRAFGATSAVPNPGRFTLSLANAQAMFGPTATAGIYRVNNSVTVATSPADFRLGQYGIGPAETSDRFPFSLYTPAVRPAERYTMFASADRKILEDNKMVAYMDIFYSQIKSQAGLAPSPAAFGTGGTNISPTYYWNQQVFGANAQNLTSWQYRFLDLGPRNNDVTFNDIAFTVGLKGDITDRIGYDVSWFYNKNEQLDVEQNGVNRTALTSVLSGTSSFGNTARAFNPFTNPFDSGVVSQDPEMLRFITLTPRTTRLNISDVFSAVLNAKPFDLPAGEVQGLLGFETRTERFTRTPDLAKQNAGGSGWNSTSFFKQSFTVRSLFTEIVFPLIADAPFTKKAQLGLAARRETFSHLEDDATIVRAFYRHQATDDLTFRASYSEGYTAPQPIDLDPTTVQSFPNLFMPWLGGADQSQLGVELVGNANLKPTESKSYNAGVVRTPENIKGLSLMVDYYQIERSNIIIQDPQLMIEAFHNGGGLTGPITGPFVKNNSAPFASQIIIDTDGTGGTGIPGYIVRIDNVQTRNIAELSAKSIDVELGYSWETASWGKVRHRLNATRVLEYEIEKLPGLIPASIYDGVYTPNDAIGPETVPHFRGFLATTWDFKGFSTDLKINHIGSYKEDPDGGTTYTSPIKAWTTFDLQVSYTVKKTGTRLTLGVENLFAKDPPIAKSSFADNYDRGSHNILGRLVHVGIKQSF